MVKTMVKTMVIVLVERAVQEVPTGSGSASIAMTHGAAARRRAHHLFTEPVRHADRHFATVAQLVERFG